MERALSRPAAGSRQGPRHAYNTSDGLRMALEIGALPHGQWTGCHSTAIDADAPPTDVLFVEAPTSEAQIETIPRSLPRPKLINMFEGGTRRWCGSRGSRSWVSGRHHTVGSAACGDPGDAGGARSDAARWKWIGAYG